MKKQKFSVMITITLVFAAFTFGFFLGRNGSTNGIRVSVPSSLQTEPTQVPQTGETTEIPTEAIHFPININTAAETEFMALPGIGEVLARRIIAYRNENGPFRVPEDLMYVEGIGEKRMEDIIEFITIGG